MSKSTYSIHTIALSALFIMGNSILMPSFYGLENTFLSFFIASALILLIIISVSKISNAVFLSNKKENIFFYAIVLLVCVISTFGALDTVYSFISFLTNIQLPQTNPILLCVAFFIPVAALTFCSNSALFKFCLLYAIISGCIIALVFISGIKSFNFSLLNVASLKELNLSKGVFGFLKQFLPAVCIAAFMALAKGNACVKQTILGAVLGLFATALCLLQSILTLGSAFDQSFPYIKAVSSISSGSLFTRLDGFCFWLFFVCALIKSAVCIKTLWLIIKCLFTKQKKKSSVFFDCSCQ